jgi:cell division protein FtsL
LADPKFFYWPRKTLKRHSNKTFLLGLLVMICLLTLYVWQRVTVIKLLKETRGYKEILAIEEKKYKYLNLEISELSSIQRIERIAQEKLGLVYPSREQIIYVNVENLDHSTIPGDLWVKLKNLGSKLNPFQEKGLQAEEIKHDL